MRTISLCSMEYNDSKACIMVLRFEPRWWKIKLRRNANGLVHLLYKDIIEDMHVSNSINCCEDLNYYYRRSLRL